MSQRRMPPVIISDINAMDDEAFTLALGGVFEHSPWIAKRAFANRPFGSIEDLHASMTSVVKNANEQEQLDLILAHPDLAGKAARAGDMTDHSVHEQASVGLDQLSDAEYNLFHELNTAYRDKFGFPFIIAVMDNTKDSILQAFTDRLENGSDIEKNNALKNILRITEIRLKAMISQDT